MGPETARIHAGMSLTEALAALVEEGLRLVFTEEVVGPHLRVVQEPQGNTPREILENLLAVHGLGVKDGAGGTLIVVPMPERFPGSLAGTVQDGASGESVAATRVALPDLDLEVATDEAGRFRMPQVRAGEWRLIVEKEGFVPSETSVVLGPHQAVDLAVDLNRTPTLLSTIDVRALPRGLPGGELAAYGLSPDDRDAFPRLSDDAFGSLAHLPGANVDDVSAAPSIRGGRTDQVLVLLDGMEIAEPYHLKDYGNVLSIVSDGALGQVRLLAGGYPVQFGGRLSGVLDLTSVDPTGPWRRQLGLSLIEARAAVSGTSGSERSRFLTVVRRGFLEIPLDLAGVAERPAFTDGFAKVDRSFGKGHLLQLHGLAADDRLTYVESEEEGDEDFRTLYRSTYVWLTHQGVLTPRRVVESRLSWSRLERDRRGLEVTELQRASVDDERSVELPGMSQDWNFQPSDRHGFKAGFNFHGQQVHFDYSHRQVLNPLLAQIFQQDPESQFDFENRFRGNQWSAYGAYQASYDRLSWEAGVRYDENTLTDDEIVSPRLDLAFSGARKNRWRLAWGRFFQNQLPYELQVEDGLTEFQPAEVADEVIVSFEHRFADRRRRPKTLRIELYDRQIQDPRIRFENLIDPISKLPEVEADRTVLAATKARARGVEIFLAGAWGPKVDWVAGYTYSTAEDRVDGRWLVHHNDQPHALDLGLTWRAPKGWRLGTALAAHTGWPTTPLLPPTADSPGPRLGSFYSERLSHYWRLDLSLARSWEVRHGRLALTLAIQNATHRRNPRGFEVAFGLAADGSVEATATPIYWPGILPNLGASWTF